MYIILSYSPTLKARVRTFRSYRRAKEFFFRFHSTPGFSSHFLKHRSGDDCQIICSVGINQAGITFFYPGRRWESMPLWCALNWPNPHYAPNSKELALGA